MKVQMSRGTVEKVYEISSTGERPYVGEHRTRGTVEGYLEKRYLSKDLVHLHIVEDGHGRESTHFHELHVRKGGDMVGRFFAMVADSEGASEVATKTVLKAMCLLLSSPLVVLSRIAVFLDLWDLKCDLSACLQKIDDAADESIAGIFVHALIAAEDRRNPFHPGIDPIGIVRAICARLTESKLQGASTIEQQFVRVVSNRYEITLPRKIREQILAIAVSRRRRKDQISSAYLAVAHYGFGLT